MLLKIDFSCPQGRCSDTVQKRKRQKEKQWWWRRDENETEKTCGENQKHEEQKRMKNRKKNKQQKKEGVSGDCHIHIHAELLPVQSTQILWRKEEPHCKSSWKGNAYTLSNVACSGRPVKRGRQQRLRAKEAVRFFLLPRQQSLRTVNHDS